LGQGWIWDGKWELDSFPEPLASSFFFLLVVAEWHDRPMNVAGEMMMIRGWVVADQNEMSLIDSKE